MNSQPDRFPELLAVIDRHWGFRQLRPLQEQAMRAVLDRRDSLVVMPTGGGKSLCFQAPALLQARETTVVVSPLIALMKDQVDSLRAAGVPAKHIDSSLTPAERIETSNALRAGTVRLLFVSPERLAMPDFQAFLQQLGVRTFAIDEAHCISHWGHDFRPEYRQLRMLRRLFPQATFHGYTATATQRVRGDIVEQLGLRNPEILVGDFDRPNLFYSVVARTSVLDQTVEVIKRHAGEAGIIYCIRRKDVDLLSSALRERGFNALGYHAGMMPDERKSAQDAFRAEKCDLVVATVAFGMGIDRSNVRFVLHTGMPKSIEHYQQEAGRAGRDGLQADCVLLYSGGDYFTWKKLLSRSTDEGLPVDPEVLRNNLEHLKQMQDYSQLEVCRHGALVEHFGQRYAHANCEACDVCVGGVDIEPQSQLIAQKILSCVARVNESFGINHVVGVLCGSRSEKIIQRGHDKLSTYGLLNENTQDQVRQWTYQLVNSRLLAQSEDEYPILKLTTESWEVMRGKRQAKLRVTERGPGPSAAQAEDESWKGVDRDLCEEIRRWRRETAEWRGWPPFTIFNDRTMRDLARVRPSNRESLRQVHGIGDMKIQDFGDDLLALIVPWCKEKGLSTDQEAGPRGPAAPQPTSLGAYACFPHFRRGMPLGEVAGSVSRSLSTVVKYLCQFIEDEKPDSISAWVPPDIHRRVLDVTKTIDTPYLRPYFEALGGQVSYDMIRIVIAHAKHYPNAVVAKS